MITVVKMLAEFSEGRRNNFDFIRFVAAVIVMISHSFLVSWGNENLEPVSRVTHGQINSGELGVYIFFIISGFLIAQSYVRRPNILVFLQSRILRIFPGLFVVLIFTLSVIGAIVNWKHLSAYFSNPKIYTYLLNIDLYSIPFNYYHLGLFWRNIFGIEANGSLWTLYYEFVCYLVVAALGLTRALRPPVVLLLFLVAYVGAFHPFPSAPRLATTLYFLRFFSTGMLFYSFRRYIPYRWHFALLSTMILVVSSILGIIYMVMPLPLAYLVFYVTYTSKLRMQGFARYGDLSYGLYIYAFPIQQLVTWAHGGRMSAHVNFMIAFPLVLGLAYLSWHVVEKRALRLKGRLLFQRSVVAKTASEKQLVP